MPDSVPAFFLSKDEYVFQQLCRDILHTEPDISGCEVYGQRGQMQRGIDVWASRRPDQKIEVGQCKRYGTLTARHVEQATKDFFAHWEFWKTQGVRRFVLFAACDISSRKVQDAILRQRPIFWKKRIKFEAWGLNDLKGKLVSLRQNVQNLYGPDVADAICGTVAETPALRAQHQWMNHNLGVVLSELGAGKGAELDGLREKSREGRHAEALADVEKIKTAPSWPSLPHVLQARFLRFEAALRLNLKQPAVRVAPLVEQAHALDPQGDFQIIDAYLKYREGAQSVALEMLSVPRSIDGWNFRWGLLLDAARGSEIEPEIARLPTGVKPNAETHRLVALAALVAGNFPKADAEAAKARALNPTHHGVRMISATVDYFSCVVLDPGKPVCLSWPPPLPWEFVKRDADSLARLRRAADEFARLAAEFPERDEEREQMEVFQLAAIVCDSARRDEATALVAKLLTANPAHYRIAAWAVERALPFDGNGVATVLLAAAAAGKLTQPDAWLACCSVLLSAKRNAEAEAAIDRAEPSFAATGNMDLWRFQKSQFLANRGLAAEAVALVEKIEDQGMRSSAQLALARIGARSRADFASLATQLETEYQSTGSPQLLFKCCEIRVRTNDWKFISEHAIELVEKLRTDAALRLALHATFNHGDYELCLNLLRQHSGLLLGGQLPPDIRSLRAECQQRLGHWQEAIAEAEALYRERPSVERFAEYFRLLLITADVPRCALVARELLELPGAGADLLLQAARVTRLQDQNLARELWRRALKLLRNDMTLMTAALGLAYELGLEREAAQLQQRLFAKGRTRSGPFQVKTFEETVAILREQRAEQERLNKVYNESAAPIHLIAKEVGAPLVELYHGALSRNRQSPNLIAAPALLARYGGRKMPDRFAVDTVYADVTGLILAADLEILDQIEAKLGPIQISADVTPSLMEQIARVTPHQPSQHAQRAEMFRLIKAKQLAVAEVPSPAPEVAESITKDLGEEWTAQWQAAAAVDGVVLADHPLVTHDGTFRPVQLPVPIGARVFNLREFLHALFLAGGLTADDWKLAVAKGTVLAGYPERAEAELAWPKDRTVALTGSLFAMLVDGGWLDAATTHFRLVISQTAVKEAETEEAAHGRREELAAWSKGLLERIQRGIAQKKYRVLPQLAKPAQAKQDLGADGVGLGTLLRHVSVAKTGVLWCDDRMVNRHLTAGSRPIIGIIEILLMLRATGALSEAEYYDKVLHLRRSNVRFLPVTPEEILHHLRQATVNNGTLVETPALAALRRYLAACLVDRERLLAPLAPVEGGRQDIREWEFALQVRRASDETLRKIWEQQSDSLEVRNAQADWLWRAVFLDVLGMRQNLVVERPIGEERELTAFAVAMNFLVGITLSISVPGASDATPAPRKGYYDWLTTRLLQPLERSNPGFVGLVAKLVADDVTATTRAALKKKSKATRIGECAVMRQLVWNLPNDLLQQLDLPADVMAGIKLKANGPTATVDGGEFDVGALWAAQAEAINGRPGQVQDRTGKRQLSFVRDDKPGGITLRVSDTASAEPKFWRESAYPLMLDAVAARVADLEQHPEWFDCPAAERQEAIQAIANAERPADRAERLHQWINKSPTVWYRQLTNQFRGQEGISADEIRLPSWSRLRAHLRFKDGAEIQPREGFSAAISDLLREEGLFKTLQRAICLPVTLPPALVDAWIALPTDDARSGWSKLRRGAPSPIAVIQISRLGLLRADMDAAEIKALFAELFDPVAGEEFADSFNSVLVWVGRELVHWPDGRALPVWQRHLMIWYHASRLHTMFRIGRADLAKLPGWFASHGGSWNESILTYDPHFADDLLHPSEASRGCIEINALVTALGGVPDDRIRLLDIPGVWTRLTKESPIQVAALQPELARRIDLAPDILGALLRRPDRAEAVRVLGESVVEELFLRNDDEEIAAGIRALVEAPYAQKSWTVLLATLRDLAAPAACRTALREALQAIDFVEFLRREPEWACVALTFAAGQARFFDDETYSRRIEEQIFAAAYAGKDALDREDSRLPLCFMQALLHLSVLNESDEANAENFFGRLDKLVRVLPSLTKFLRRATQFWMTSLPFSQQRAFWRLLLTVRALY